MVCFCSREFDSAQSGPCLYFGVTVTQKTKKYEWLVRFCRPAVIEKKIGTVTEPYLSFSLATESTI